MSTHRSDSKPPPSFWRFVSDVLSQPFENTGPRKLTDEDFDAWEVASNSRMPERTRENVRALIRQRNPVRWNRMQRDLKWVAKEMEKINLNPEDARYII